MSIRLRLRLDELREQLYRLDSAPETSPQDSEQSPLLAIILKEEQRHRLTREQSAGLDYLDSIVYPILTLPLEITSEIFLHCLPDAPVLPDETTAPMLLTRICQTWRNIALREPRLWSSLKIKSTRVLRTAQDWLRRAGSLPQYHGVTLPLKKDDEDVHYLFEDPIEDPFCEDTPGHYLSGSWVLPTSFFGENFTGDECFALLRRVPKLIRCEFSLVEWHDPLTFAHKPLLHTKLQSLTLRDPDNGGIDLSSFHLFQLLDLPALQMLDLGLCYFSTDATCLLSFLQKANTIHHFSADFEAAPERSHSNLVSALSAIPTLTHLVLGLWLHDTAFIILRLLSASDVCLPNLEHIAFTILDDVFEWEDIHTRDLLAALTSRSRPQPRVAQLLDFSLIIRKSKFGDGKPPIDLTDSLRELKNKGMKLRFGSLESDWV
ncbi:hypothetical protein C8R44DRAFT_988055 [Mycena epipterygia]|nr:hypothetical protein C8R44DRAFT_988055 [Mycena epipterygia]